MSAVPDGLPTLSKGGHVPGSSEACVMEYVSVITGSEWTDKPPCTNLIIAKAAQAVNDNLSDEDRHRIVPFIGRLMEAGAVTEEINEALYARLGLFRSMGFGDRVNWVGNQVSEAIYNWYGPNLADYRYTPEAGIKLLDDLLTIHEDMTGRAAAPVPTEALNRAKALIETGKGLI